MVNAKNIKEILDYLKSTDTWGKSPIEAIAKHLDQLVKYDQLEIVEGNDGSLLYAWGWYLLTDKALKEYKEFTPPKRINRGSNMVGLFCINNFLSPTSLLKAARRAMKMCRAKTFTVYTTRGKWVTVKARYGLAIEKRKRQVLARQALRILTGGNKECLQHLH